MSAICLLHALSKLDPVLSQPKNVTVGGRGVNSSPGEELVPVVNVDDQALKPGPIVSRLPRGVSIHQIGRHGDSKCVSS